MKEILLKSLEELKSNKGKYLRSELKYLPIAKVYSLGDEYLICFFYNITAYFNDNPTIEISFTEDTLDNIFNSVGKMDNFENIITTLKIVK